MEEVDFGSLKGMHGMMRVDSAYPMRCEVRVEGFKIRNGCLMLHVRPMRGDGDGFVIADDVELFVRWRNLVCMNLWIFSTYAHTILCTGYC